MHKQRIAFIKLLSSMLIFGSIGLLVHYIPLPSSFVALIRAIFGVLFLSLVLLIKRDRLSFDSIKKNFVYLLLSGIAIGFNWILLFESYRYTSVAVSTLCYYMAPMIVTLLSPLVLKEKLSIKCVLCVVVALVGLTLISGMFTNDVLQGGEMTGIAFGFGAAILYASVILMNKKMRHISAMDRTVCQLFISSALLLPYNLFTCDVSTLVITPSVWLLLAVAGIIHTGFAYYLYFGSMEHLSGQSIALASYIDPVVAVIISITILREPFDMYTIFGAIAILGSALVSEFTGRGGNTHDH